MQSALGHGCLGLGRRNSRTITTVGRRQTGRPVRPVQGSVLVAMVDPVRRSPRSASRNNPGVTTRPAVTISSCWSSRRGVATVQTNRAYARGICEGIAVHAG
jgi:hypothetical protein